MDGRFGFKVDSLPVSLDISSMGYGTNQVIISETDTFKIIILETVPVSLNEVNVFAGRNSLQASSLESLRNSESYNLAGTTKDIFRSVQMLPGVSTNNAASARYNVRGGTYDENLMLINGIEVAEPYHIKVFPMASVGIFNIDMVQKIDFSAGGFSAEYGDALSSVLNVEYRSAGRDSVTGRVNLGMIDLGLVAGVPVGKRSSFLLGARHSYLDPIVGIVHPEEKVSIRYYDIQAKYDFDIDSRNKISLLAIYSEDKDKVGPESGIYSDTASGIFMGNPIGIYRQEEDYFFLDARYDDMILALSGKHRLSENLLLNTRMSYYRENEFSPITEKESISFSFSEPGLFSHIERMQNESQDYTLENIEAKLDARIRFNQRNNTTAGIRVRHSAYNYLNFIQTSFYTFNNTDVYPDTTEQTDYPSDPEYNTSSIFKAEANKFSAYVSHFLQWNNSLTLNIGIRADYFDLNQRTDISPRISLQYLLNYGVRVYAAWGEFYKSPMMRQLKYNYSTTENTRSQKATHYLAGAEKKFKSSTIKVEAYFKKYDDLLPVRRTAMSRIIYPVKDNNAEGYAGGADFQYILTGRKIDVWFNYSLIETKERLKGTENYYSRYTDQTHAFSTLLLYKYHKNSDIGLKVSYGSGYTFERRFFDETLKQWLTYPETMTGRLPYFLSLDIRFNLRFSLFSAPSQLYVDVINSLNRKNSIGHTYGINNNLPFEEDFEFYGIVPTFGIMFDF